MELISLGCAFIIGLFALVFALIGAAIVIVFNAWPLILLGFIVWFGYKAYKTKPESTPKKETT